MSTEEGERERFGVVDVLRIVGGLLLVNALASYWLTSSATWGYKVDEKYTDVRYLKHRMVGPELELSMAELALYNGSDPALPIYVGVYGEVYDVSASRGIYGPKGSYHVFAGRDCARAFHNGCFGRADQLTYDLRGVEDMDAAWRDIAGWQAYYGGHGKYWRVGTVVHDELVGDAPAPCRGPRYPGT